MRYHFAVPSFPQVLRNDLDLSTFMQRDLHISPLQENYLSDELREWLRERELRHRPGIIFFRRSAANDGRAPHIDLTPYDNRRESCGINVELFGKGSMSWYEPIDGDPGYHIQSPVNRVAAIMWRMDRVREVERITFDGVPRLVRVDIPHMVQVLDGPRLAVSVRFERADRGLTFDELYPVLQQDLSEHL